MPRTPNPTADDSLTQQLNQLAHPHRRRILIALTRHNPRKGEEFESIDFAATGEDPDQFRLKLYHNHLPKLDGADIIDWDPESDSVTRGPRFDEIEPLVNLLIEHQQELPSGWP